jgi:hypothetical protein
VADEVPVAFERFVEGERRAERFTGTREPLASGAVNEWLRVDTKEANRLLIEAAKHASGFYRPTKRTELVWVNGDSELAVGIGGVRLETSDGVLVVTIPVRCDQTERTEVHVTFAVGQPGRPAGLYASTQRRPRGPAVIVDTWGDALVAFAWQIVLGLVSGLAGATGKDRRGNRLVPVELEATREALQIVPMARHHFTGSTGLTSKTL